MYAALIEVDVGGVFGPGSSPALSASVVRCELREVAATA
jgi:hypothetical protein